jgi:chemotaxis regulatin CheY-phosphate phosphatase CheZ
MAEILIESKKELQAAIKETEKAANSFMDIAENLQKLIPEIADKNLSEKIQNFVTKIFESSDFQDIVSQRLAKVVSNIDEIKNHGGVNFERKKKTKEEELLNGPQLETANQAEIDKLFNS